MDSYELCIMILVKLHVHVCISNEAVLFGSDLKTVILCGWEGNCVPVQWCGCIMRVR